MLTDQAQSEASKKYMLGNLNYHQHISAARHQVRLNKSCDQIHNFYLLKGPPSQVEKIPLFFLMNPSLSF